MPHKLFISFICIIAVSACTNTNTPHFNNKEQEKVFELMVDIFNHEVENFSSYTNSNTWQNSTFFIGAMAAYNKTGFKDFLFESYNWAEANNWQLGKRKFHADDQAAAQVYLSLYKVGKEPYMIADYLSEVQKMAKIQPDRNNELLWWWADALFMAPPALTELSSVLNTDRFSIYAFQEWKKTYKLLYNKEDSLFYRDKKKYNHIDKMGRKVYWLRGNGWVIAGLAKMLSILDSEKRSYQKYMTVYLEMINKLITLQSDNGLWRSALLRPKEYPIPDTSGSALVCYALAWGVNSAILQDSIYESALLDCWRGLKSKINTSGILISAQPVGHQPTHFSPNNSEVFASGAFLLAASEVFEYKSN